MPQKGSGPLNVISRSLHSIDWNELSLFSSFSFLIFPNHFRIDYIFCSALLGFRTLCQFLVLDNLFPFLTAFSNYVIPFWKMLVSLSRLSECLVSGPYTTIPVFFCCFRALCKPLDGISVKLRDGLFVVNFYEAK